MVPAVNSDILITKNKLQTVIVNCLTFTASFSYTWAKTKVIISEHADTNKRMNKTWLTSTYNACQDHRNSKCWSSHSFLQANSNCKRCYSCWMWRGHSTWPKHPSRIPSLFFVPAHLGWYLERLNKNLFMIWGNKQKKKKRVHIKIHKQHFIY